MYFLSSLEQRQRVFKNRNERPRGRHAYTGHRHEADIPRPSTTRGPVPCPSLSAATGERVRADSRIPHTHCAPCCNSMRRSHQGDRRARPTTRRGAVRAADAQASTWPTWRPTTSPPARSRAATYTRSSGERAQLTPAVHAAGRATAAPSPCPRMPPGARSRTRQHAARSSRHRARPQRGAFSQRCRP